MAEQSNETQKLREFIYRLEEERLKIDAFKRELPLCMQLLNNAMEAYKKQANQLPLTNVIMGAQLWSSAAAGKQIPAEFSSALSPMKLSLDSKPRCGAFHPFSKDKSKEITSSSNPSLKFGRISPNFDMDAAEIDAIKIEESGSPAAALRKARRCWSTDLHRRFVNALHILGGSQVATPKQIRELMKVEGLTNDEVKSHLQKYRLHTRRPMSSPAGVSTAAPPLLVLGGFWVPPEYATSGHSPASATLYGTHNLPPHYCSPPQGSHDYFHGHLSAAHRYGRQVSPASDNRSGEEWSESVDGGRKGRRRVDEEEEVVDNEKTASA